MDKTGRVLNLSSAAQAPINIDALLGQASLSTNQAYAQSKLALTIWSREMAKQRKNGPIIISVNPGSLLGTKMVKDAYGMVGKDITIGANILTRLSVDLAFDDANGQYFDNDIGQFSQPHPDVMNTQITEPLMQTLGDMLSPYMKTE